MTKRNILLLGSGSIADEMTTWLEACGDHVSRLGVNRPIEQSEASSADVIMDVHSDLSQKIEAWEAVEPHVTRDAIMLTSCTAACGTRVASLVGEHIPLAGFNPWFVLAQDVIEVSRPLQLEDDQQWEQLQRFWQQRGKQIEVVDDTPGLVFPRILSLLVNEAAFALGEGVATAEDIDCAMKYGTNYPQGPLAWADEIGVDEILAVLQSLHDAYGEDRYRPSFYLKRLVYAGWTGKKAGRGFYRWKGW